MKQTLGTEPQRHKELQKLNLLWVADTGKVAILGWNVNSIFRVPDIFSVDKPVVWNTLQKYGHCIPEGTA